MTDFAQYFGKDPSWAVASELVRSCMGQPHTLWRLVRQTWQSGVDEVEFVRLLCTSKTPSTPLLAAAELMSPDAKVNKDRETLAQAVTTLGSRYASVVLATAACLTYIKRCNDQAISLQIARELMTCVEVGYRFGTKVLGIGAEGGAMMGLTMMLGESVLVGIRARESRTWWKELPRERKALVKKHFGCETYQIAALALQNLGFGYEAPCGVVLANCRRDALPETFPESATQWQATYEWVEALRYGKNYPALERSRKMFREVIPPEAGTNHRNLHLEALYAEISRLRSEGSEWKWY